MTGAQTSVGAADTGTLPEGVSVVILTPHHDERGTFTEVHRDEWDTGVSPAQWNLVHSRAGTLRGVHVHLRHADYLTVAAGRLVLGLADLRPDRPPHRARIELKASSPLAVTIPTGVAHGFWFPEPSIHLYAVSRTFDPQDELGCRWDDADLGIPWDPRPTLVSDRDRGLPSLGDLRAELARRGL